ncbi:MAG: flagellar biosynthetic protein FliR, partial [Bdellovibrionales bacterium]|nr:flagellar biosynthetic protein FliR [Bdellovibrionales bacterium]
SDQFDFLFLWTWFLISTRATGLLIAAPGIGSQEIPATAKMLFSFILGFAIAISGVQATEPATAVDGVLMVVSEFLLGWAIAFIPQLIVSSLSVSGQVISGSIGLGFANLIDPSIGQSVSILSRVQIMVATLVFLLIDGHHVLIRALAGFEGMPLGGFLPSFQLADFLLVRFAASFELGVICAAPILVSILVAQFVLGLLTKSVPQVNIFIISLPLTIGMGLYILAFTFPGIVQNLVDEYRLLPELIGQLFLFRA